jgi:hypothetical protein
MKALGYAEDLTAKSSVQRRHFITPELGGWRSGDRDDQHIVRKYIGVDDILFVCGPARCKKIRLVCDRQGDCGSDPFEIVHGNYLMVALSPGG